MQDFLTQMETEFSGASHFWEEYVQVMTGIITQGATPQVQTLAPILTGGCENRRGLYRVLVKRILMEFYSEILDLQSFAITHYDCYMRLLEVHRSAILPGHDVAMHVPPSLEGIGIFDYRRKLAPLFGAVESVYAEYFTGQDLGE